MNLRTATARRILAEQIDALGTVVTPKRTALVTRLNAALAATPGAIRPLLLCGSCERTLEIVGQVTGCDADIARSDAVVSLAPVCECCESTAHTTAQCPSVPGSDAARDADYAAEGRVSL